MFKRIYIFSVASQHTTANYFESAIRLDNFECYLCHTLPQINQLSSDDLFLFIDPVSDWPLELEKIKCYTAAYFIDVHQHLESRLRLAKFFDLTFVAQREYITAFNNDGCEQVYWLPLACDLATHYQPSSIKLYDVGFVGKLGMRGTWRYDTLTKVLEKFKTNNYNRFYQPQEMGQTYSKSKIVFNASIGKELNMRFFEALASGALLVTDRIPNAIDNIFVENVHYVGYSDNNEAIEKIRYYLEHENERCRIAETGHTLAKLKHTYLHRWLQIKETLEICEKNGQARQLTKQQLANLYVHIFVDLRQPLRILKVFITYGITIHALTLFAKAIGRWLNAYIPLTPNAIRYRLKK